MEFIGTAFMFVVAIIARGFVFSELWLWFIVPFDIITISIPHAMGISFTVGYITKTVPKITDKPKTRKEWKDDIIRSCLLPLAAYGIGFIIKSFM